MQRSLRVSSLVFVFDVYQLIVTSPGYDDAKYFIIILVQDKNKGAY
jgi:hypothetical protein